MLMLSRYAYSLFAYVSAFHGGILDRALAGDRLGLLQLFQCCAVAGRSFQRFLQSVFHFWRPYASGGERPRQTSLGQTPITGSDVADDWNGVRVFRVV